MKLETYQVLAVDDLCISTCTHTTILSSTALDNPLNCWGFHCYCGS